MNNSIVLQRFRADHLLGQPLVKYSLIFVFVNILLSIAHQ